MKKKIVILTGAGFTDLWDAPNTKKITNSVVDIDDPLIKLVKELLNAQKGIEQKNKAKNKIPNLTLKTLSMK